MTQVQYLGYIIDEHGVHVDPAKIQVIRDWPSPTTLMELHSFLGLANFYRRFTLGFSHITWPLSQVTKGGPKAKFFWKYIRSCTACAIAKPTAKKQGLYTPLPTPSRPWESIAMDYMLGLPSTKHGDYCVFVVVDKFSKMAIMVACKKNITVETTAKLLFERVWVHFGMPQSIISDRDSRFFSTFWSSLWSMLDTKLTKSTAFHPQTDSQTEVGDKVWLRLQKESLTGAYRELKPLRYGPYTITKGLGDNAFKLSIPPFLGLHLVFNVDRLRPYFPPLLDTSDIAEQLTTIKLNPDCMEQAATDRIMDTQIKHTRQQNIQLYRFVKAGQLLHQGKWLTRDQVQQKFPHLMEELNVMGTIAS
eukprot:PITA_30167